MTESTANTVWARSLVDELARAGLREVVIAPGSRSTPLIMACAADERLRVRVHLDERSCGFFALGVGKATGRPAAIITTSGTAVANLFPAVVEANQAGVPLIVLSADRPNRLRGADANQAIDQYEIFGRYPRAFFQLSEPTLDSRALRHLRGLAARVWDKAGGSFPGPVHVNVPFDKPLEPQDLLPSLVVEDSLAFEGRADGSPMVCIESSRPVVTEQQLGGLVDRLAGRAVVVVAGPTEEASLLGPAVRHFASVTGFPLLADPLSGARFGFDDSARVIGGYDLFLRDARVREHLVPEVVVRVGTSPTSASLQRWLFQNAAAEQLVIDDGPRWKDHGGTAETYFRVNATDALTRMSTIWSTLDATSQGRSIEHCRAWTKADHAAQEALLSLSDSQLGEGEVAMATLRALPDGSALVVSSSMPIRDLDAFAAPSEKSVDIFANRGASGIDGVVSTAFGIASQRSGPAALLIGDVAFFHDQNGLLWSREADAPVVIVLVDNDGGAIFGMLPIANFEPEFTEYFTTPHGLDPSHTAAAHGVEVVETSVEKLEDHVRAAIGLGETRLIRVRTDGAEGHRMRTLWQDAVIEKVLEVLS